MPIEACCAVNRSSLAVDTDIKDATDFHDLQADPPVEFRDFIDAASGSSSSAFPFAGRQLTRC